MSVIERAWQEFYAQRESVRAKFFRSNRTRMNGRVILPESILFPRQFNRELLDYTFRLADATRELENVDETAGWLRTIPQLRRKSVCIVFKQKSTRTNLSHQAAAMILGLPFAHIEDMSMSSESKGEDTLDTMLALAEYYDVIIIRDATQGFVEKVAWHLKVNGRRNTIVINAGSSLDHHPTQAELDYYTMYRWFRSRGGLEDKTILYAGDNRGRTVRDNAYLARNYPGLKLIFAAPDEFQIQPDILEYLGRHDVPFEVTDQFEAAIREVDGVYMTRIQNDPDYQDKSDVDQVELAADQQKLLEAIQEFLDTSELPYELKKKSSLSAEAMSYFNPKFALTRDLMRDVVSAGTIVMHPGPRRGELPTELDKDPRVKVWSQVRNGMWIRVVNFLFTFGVDEEIVRKRPDNFA